MSRVQHLTLHVFNIGTILLWGWNLLEFFTKGEWPVSETMANIYLILLTYYVTDKELRRWHSNYVSHRRPGEMIVVGWVLTVLAMLAIETAGGAEHGYIVPRQLPLIAATVTIIFVISEYVKTEFRRSAARKSESRSLPGRASGFRKKGR